MAEVTAHTTVSRVKFTPEIHLGHVFQAIVVVLTLSGWGMWGYTELMGDITGLRTENVLIKQRQDQQDLALKNLADSVKDSNHENQTALHEMGRDVADIRVAVGAGKKGDGR